MLLKLGQVPTLVVSSSQLAKEIMKTHDLIFASRPHLKTANIILYGSQDVSFSPYGEHWRQMRKICVVNLFSMKRLQSFQAAREEEVAHFIDKIYRISTSQSSPVNLSKLLFSFTNDILCKVILGEFSREEDRNKRFHEIIEETVLLISGFNMLDYFPSLGWLSSLFGLDERSKRNYRMWDDVLDQMIEDHANKTEEKLEDNDFIDILLSIHKKDTDHMNFCLTKDYMKALLLDMFSAGIDTTYIVLEWSLAELIKNPQVMKKLKDEIRATVCNKSMVKEEDLSKMKYLKAFIKEILRLHPPVPLLLPRESMERCQLGGFEIPKKTRVVINYWAITRDPEAWKSPEEFRPERFKNSSIDFKGQDYQYIPFGAGRRMCPGFQFAVLTVELALANLVHRFDWQFVGCNNVGEGLDMSEAPGLTTRMNKSLYLVPKPCF